jgi:hypothetical protein
MRAELQGVHLTAEAVKVPSALASAITTLREEIVPSLRHNDFAKGWTKASRRVHRRFLDLFCHWDCWSSKRSRNAG